MVKRKARWVAGVRWRLVLVTRVVHLLALWWEVLWAWCGFGWDLKSDLGLRIVGVVQGRWEWEMKSI